MQTLQNKNQSFLSLRMRIGNSFVYKGDGVCGVCQASKYGTFGFTYIGSVEQDYYLPFCTVCEVACCRWYIDFVRNRFDLNSEAIQKGIEKLKYTVEQSRLCFIRYGNLEHLHLYIGDTNPFINKRFKEGVCAVCTGEKAKNKCSICKSYCCTECSKFFFHGICAGCRFDAAKLCLTLIIARFQLDAPMVREAFALYAEFYEDGTLPGYYYDIRDMISRPPLQGNFYSFFVRDNLKIDT